MPQYTTVSNDNIRVWLFFFFLFDTNKIKTIYTSITRLMSDRGVM